MNPRSGRMLVRLYPRRWRGRYGPEFAALLADTPLTPAVIVDVARHPAGEHVSARPLVTALLVFALLDGAAVLGGITRNILWAPTTPLRALVLAVTVTPLIAALTTIVARRRTVQR